MLLFFDRNALKVVKTTRVWCLADRLTVVDYRGFEYRGFELSTSELVRGGYETLSLLVFRNLFCFLSLSGNTFLKTFVFGVDHFRR